MTPATTPAGTEPAGPAVVVAGDALIDLTPTRTTRGVLAYEPHPGGSCLNVAVGLARLGVPTSLLARVSTDYFGGLIRTHLAASGVSDRHLLETDDLSCLAAVHLDGDRVRYSFHSVEAADRGLRPEHLAALPDGDELPPGAALHVGSIALMQEPQASTLDALLRRESGRRLICLDPNVRPSLIADRAAYLERLAGWVALADIVKVSEEDLNWLYPGEDHGTVALGWLDAGAALILVTLGSRGAWALTRRARGAVPAPAVFVADTVGAGDAFTAAALSHLYATGRLSRAGVTALTSRGLTGLLTEAAALAADCCRRTGADPAWRGHAPLAPATATTASVAELVERAQALIDRGGRRILGLTGAPGAGKSTLARALVDALGPEQAVLVPMDGFHLANVTLRALGRRDRKGAWDTFDAGGYVGLLRRLRALDEPVVHAPDFDRALDESIGSALPVPRDVPLVVTEGNYLLSQEGAWAQVAALLDECWFIDIADPLRQQRLIDRRLGYGEPREHAVAWALGSDQANAEVVDRARGRADLVVSLSG